MPRRFNKNKNRRDNLAKRKRKYIQNNAKFVSNKVELQQNKRNSLFGAVSQRANSVGKQVIGRGDLHGMKMAAFRDASLNEVYERYGNFGSGRNNLTRNQEDRCVFTCTLYNKDTQQETTQDVEVFPGTCIRCPQNAFCPDDLDCKGPSDTSGTYIDDGWACCSCASADWAGYDGQAYGKKFSRAYMGFHGDSYCDDGVEIMHYYDNNLGNLGYTHDFVTFYNQMEYGCTNSNCQPYGPSNENSFDNGPAENLYIFPWSDEQNITTFQATDLYNGNPPPANLIGSGRVPLHFMCPEWGWDCGGFAREYIESGSTNACLGPFYGLEQFYMDQLGINTNNAGDFTGGSHDYGGNGPTWITEEHDPYHHCDYVRNLPGTCKGKCNRREYLDSPLGFDPGGFSKTPGGSDPGYCFCDGECSWCGCNYNRYGTTLYNQCIAGCNPGAGDGPDGRGCEDPMHPNFSDGTWDPELNIPGESCNVDNYPGGDCCGDYVEYCEIPNLEWPCECYDETGSIGWLEGNGVTYEDCTVGTENALCTYAGPTPGGAYCEDDDDCEEDCRAYCESISESESAAVNWSWWNDLNENNDNMYCSIWDYNHNIMGRDSYDISNWKIVPSCPVDYYLSSCGLFEDNQCECNCSDCTIDNEPLNTFTNVPNIGCAGVGSFMLDGTILEEGNLNSEGYARTRACNHTYDIGGDEHNCSPNWILTQNNNYWSFADVDGYGFCNFGSNQFESGRNITDVPIFVNGYEGILEDNQTNHQIFYVGQYFTEKYMELPGNENLSETEARNQIMNDLKSGCRGCPDPWAANYTGIGIYVTQSELQSMNQSGTAYDLTYGKHEQFGLDGPVMGFAIDSQGNYCLEDFGGPNDGTCDTSLCVYEYGCPPDENDEGTYLNHNGMCCGGSSDTSDGYQCYLNPVCETQNECTSGYQYCKSVMGCLTTMDATACCAQAINYVCTTPGACNYLQECDPSQFGNSSEGLIDSNGWFGTAEAPCLPAPIQDEVCTYPTPYCSDCDGDGVRSPDDPQGNCGDDLSGTEAGNGPWDVCLEPVANGTVPAVCDPNIFDDCINFVPQNGGNGFVAVPCSPEDDIFPNCPTNTTHGTFGERPCINSPVEGEDELFADTCCLSGGCCDLTNPQDERTPVCDGEYVLGYDDGVNYDNYGRPNGFLYCCRQQDDCGYCVLDNEGMYETAEVYTYEAGDGCFIGGELAPGAEFLPECQCISGTYNIPTYTNIATGETYCSCDEGTILDCTCSTTAVGDNANNSSCGTGNIQGCAGCAPPADNTADDCGLCPEETGYGNVVIDCVAQPSGEGGTIGQQCTCPNEDGSFNVCDCAGNCVPPGAGASQITYYGDHEGDGCCDQEDTQTYCSNITDIPSGYFTENDCMITCNDQWDVDPEDDCPNNNYDDCDVCNGNNVNMDCNGDCFGTAYIDECGECVGGNTGAGTRIDECGICANGINEYQIINSIGEQVQITYGSFGCENRQWFDSQYDNSGGRCEVEHCGCQCAGCTNIFSPAYTDKAKYSVECTSEEKASGLCNSWFCGDGPNVITGEYNYCQTDYCENAAIGWSTSNTRWEIRREYGLIYCNQLYDVGTPEYLDCLETEEWQSMCVGDDGILIDGSFCLPGIFECAVGQCTSDIILDISFDLFKAHGYPEAGSGYYFHYCSNQASANPTCDTYVGNPTEAQLIIDEHGADCAGTGADDHCRVGVRSDLYWNVSRSSQEDIPNYTYEDYLYEWFQSESGGAAGDVNSDGAVNIQDVILTINYILGTTPPAEFTFAEIMRMDFNLDGIINILDVVRLVNSILEIQTREGRSNRSSLRPTEESLLIQELLSLGMSMNQGVRLSGQSRISQRTNLTYIRYLKSIERYRYVFQSSNRDTRNNDYIVNKMKFIFNAPTCIPQDVGIEIGETFNTTSGGEADWGRQVILPESGDNFFILTMEQQDYLAGIDITDLGNHLLTIYHENVHFQVAPQFPITYSQDEGYNLITRDIAGFLASGCTIDSGNCYLQDGNPNPGCLDEDGSVVCLQNYEIRGVLGSDVVDHYHLDSNCLGSNCYDNKFWWTYKEKTCTML